MDSRDATDAALQTEVIDSVERFDALQADWDDLIERARVPHPFMSHLWLLSWWECFGSHWGKLRVVLVWEGRRLVAAAPMALRRTQMYGLPLRALETLYNDHTPRFEFVLSRHDDAVLDRLWGAISAIPCDALVLKQFPDDSAVLAALRERARGAGWHGGTWAASRQPYIPLEDDHQRILQRMKSKQRYNLRKRHKDLAKLGELELEQVTDPALLEAALDDGLRIEAAAWKGEAGTAMASQPEVREFYGRLAARAAKAGWLRLVFLKLDGRRISFDYILDYGKTVYGVKIGYDPQYRKYAPGHTLLTLILEQACQQGFTEYDFLGDDDEWKLLWTGEVRAHSWLFLFRPSLRGRLLRALKFDLVPRFKERLAGLRRRR